ncbi:MAG: nitroreductase family protein [Prevotellaceae bacterium]|nr:nitroreductase family protein [Prevotellaceae bacterium]
MTLLEQSLRRRSVRQYSDREVTDELLSSLLEAASHTQTMGNLQLYSVVVTRDKAMKQALSPLHFDQPMVIGAPVVLTVCADYNRTTRWCEERKAEPGYDNFLSFLNAAIDALLFTQTFCCLAEEAGLGLCYLGTTVYQPEKIIETLRLPRLVMPLATLTLGWPAEEPPVSDRLPLSAFVHREAYRDYTPSLIDSLYAQKEALPENKHFVELNQKETLAQVFTDIRYTRRDNEQMSEGFIKALRRQGFL